MAAPQKSSHDKHVPLCESENGMVGQVEQYSFQWALSQETVQLFLMEAYQNVATSIKHAYKATNLSIL